MQTGGTGVRGIWQPVRTGWGGITGRRFTVETGQPVTFSADCGRTGRTHTGHEDRKSQRLQLIVTDAAHTAGSVRAGGS